MRKPLCLRQFDTAYDTLCSLCVEGHKFTHNYTMQSHKLAVSISKTFVLDQLCLRKTQIYSESSARNFVRMHVKKISINVG